MNRTDRLMGILLELQARGELRAEDLAATFEVSVRTIYRDVEALSETGVPVIATPGKGYRLMEGYFLPPLSFTADEAALLALGGELVRDRVDPLLRQAAVEALRKLAGVLPPERRADVERRRQGLMFGSLARTTTDRRLVLSRQAIEERRVVRLLYHALRRERPEPRDVEPIRLLHLTDAWYLAGYCRLRQDARLFRLDRVDRLELLDERFEVGERHALTGKYQRDVAGHPEARIRFDRSVLRWVRERQPFFLLREERAGEEPSGQEAARQGRDDQTRGRHEGKGGPAGSGQGGGNQEPVFVYALRDEDELLAWLLPWGRAVEVLSPASLRARLAEEARAILDRHAEAAAIPAT